MDKKLDAGALHLAAKAVSGAGASIQKEREYKHVGIYRAIEDINLIIRDLDRVLEDITHTGEFDGERDDSPPTSLVQFMDSAQDDITQKITAARERIGRIRSLIL